MDVPETRYAKAADGLHVAYQVVGDGCVDLVWVPYDYSNIEATRNTSRPSTDPPGRIGALVDASQVFASRTVKALTTGSGLGFDDAGEHEPKGVSDRWRLYRVGA